MTLYCSRTLANARDSWVRDKWLYYSKHSKQHEHQHICVCYLCRQVLWGAMCWVLTHSGFVSQLRTLGLGKSIIFIASGKQACSVSSQDVTSSLKVTGWINNPEKYLRRAVKACKLSIASKTREGAGDPRRTVSIFLKHRSDNKEAPRKRKREIPGRNQPTP